MVVAFAAASLGCGSQAGRASRAADRPIRSNKETPRDNPDAAAADDAWAPVFFDIEGVEHRPLEGDGVKAFAVVFVTTDCPIANLYLPELNRLHESFASRGVPMILIHSEPEVTIDQVRNHVEEYEIRPPVMIDRKLHLAQRAGATRTPEAAVFSPTGERLYRGRIDDRYVGFGKRRTEATRHDLRDALEAIVAGRAIPHPVTEAVGCYLPEPPSQEE